MENKKIKILKCSFASLLLITINITFSACRNVRTTSNESVLRDIIKDIQLYQSSDSITIMDDDLIKLESIDDNETYHKKIVELKICIYSATKQYAKGSQYVSSLTDYDFDKSYQRCYYFNMFKALNCEKRNEVKAKRHFEAASDCICEYLNNNVDDIALCELANIHKIYLKENDIEWIINKYGKSQKYDSSFIDGLRNTSNTEQQVVID